jgi:ATP-dependent DNA ligase
MAELRELQGDAWLHEVKFDGCRILGWIFDGAARLISRK